MEFLVKGLNICRPNTRYIWSKLCVFDFRFHFILLCICIGGWFNIATFTYFYRLLCALEGKYLVNECHADIMGGTESFIEQAEIQTLSFSCTVPNVNGRGFVEVISCSH